MSKHFYLGIDLGSTTSKAVILNDKEVMVGKGLTNTRSNYEVATQIAKLEALYNTRFYLLRQQLSPLSELYPVYDRYVSDLENAFRYIIFKRQLRLLLAQMDVTASQASDTSQVQAVRAHVADIITRVDDLMRTG